jgi:hypothetical protein
LLGRFSRLGRLLDKTLTVLERWAFLATYKMSKNLELDIDDARFTFPSIRKRKSPNNFRSLEYTFCATDVDAAQVSAANVARYEEQRFGDPADPSPVWKIACGLTCSSGICARRGHRCSSWTKIPNWPMIPSRRRRAQFGEATHSFRTLIEALGVADAHHHENCWIRQLLQDHRANASAFEFAWTAPTS